MMKARGRLFNLLMALVCLLPLGASLIGFGDSASAATPEDVKVTLHKKKMDEFPDGGIKNTGELMPEYENNYEPLPGVEFTVYDVTEDFYRLLALTGNETQDQYKQKAEALLKAFNFNDVVDPDSKIKDQKVTSDPAGTAEFTLPDRDADGTYKVYLFRETAGAGGTAFSQPVVLMLPAKKVGSDEANQDIHLYPKNQVGNDPIKELLEDDKNTPVDPNEDRHSFDVGKQIYYRASFVIPNQIGEILKDGNDVETQTRYSQLVFKDEVDKQGIKFGGIEQIKIGNNVVPLDTFAPPIYADTKQNNMDPNYSATGTAGFEISFKFNEGKNGQQQTQFQTSKLVAQHLDQWRGKKIEILYSVILTDDTEVDVDIKNNFYVDLTNKGDAQHKTIDDEDLPVITTGGKKFKKHDSTDEDQGLKGAEFVVTRKDPNDPNKTQYLKEGANKREWVAVAANYPDAKKVVSNQDGLFEISGIEYGNYELVEVKAPNGFVKSDTPIPFVVDKDSYGKVDAFKDGLVPNTSKGGFLPSTGGKGIIAFIVVGLGLMTFAYFRYRKVQSRA